MDFSLWASVHSFRVLSGSSTGHTQQTHSQAPMHGVCAYGQLNAKVNFMCSLNTLAVPDRSGNFYFSFREIKVATRRARARHTMRLQNKSE